LGPEPSRGDVPPSVMDPKVFAHEDAAAGSWGPGREWCSYRAAGSCSRRYLCRMCSGLQVSPFRRTHRPAGPHSVLKPPQFGIKSRTPPAGRELARIRFVAGSLEATPLPRSLLAMQKVVGSNPISRFGNACKSRAFVVGLPDKTSLSADTARTPRSSRHPETPKRAYPCKRHVCARAAKRTDQIQPSRRGRRSRQHLTFMCRAPHLLQCHRPAPSFAR
jgi:hypothetical protein